jgi:hypothetical protein
VTRVVEEVIRIAVKQSSIIEEPNISVILWLERSGLGWLAAMLASVLFRVGFSRKLSLVS